MKTKICSACNKEKRITEFRPHRKYCKKCGNIMLKEWKEKNKEHIKEYNKNYFQEHKEEILTDRKEYMYNYRQTSKYKKHKKEYANQNKEKVNEQRKERYANDMVFKLKHNVRVKISRGFKLKNKEKSKHAEELTECSLDYLVKYLLQTYKNNYGCEWDGKEKVHIDHIIPLATAKTEDDIIKLCHYTNLQLLRAKDNLKKWCLIER